MDAAEWLVRSELSYDDGAFFARLDADFTGGRFYTYLNDAGAWSYMLINTGCGYRFSSLGMIEQLTSLTAVVNFADKGV